MIQEMIDDSGLSEKLNAVSIGYNRAINLTPSAPLYLEIGAALQYAFYSDEIDLNDYHDKITGSMLTAKIPVSLLYHVAIPNSDFAIEPFAGIDFKYNIIGTAKSEETYKNYGETKKDEEKIDNIFDKKDCDGHPANRFQAGWHVGANFVYKKAFIGVSYGKDFSKFHDDIDLKFNTLSATLGCRF